MSHSPIHSHTHWARYTVLFVLIIHTHGRQRRVQCLAQGHFNMWTARSQTTDLPLGRRLPFLLSYSRPSTGSVAWLPKGLKVHTASTFFPFERYFIPKWGSSNKSWKKTEICSGEIWEKKEKNKCPVFILSSFYGLISFDRMLNKHASKQ